MLRYNHSHDIIIYVPGYNLFKYFTFLIEKATGAVRLSCLHGYYFQEGLFVTLNCSGTSPVFMYGEESLSMNSKPTGCLEGMCLTNVHVM